MRWSKSFISSEDAKSQVLEYTPQKFVLGTPEQALSYLEGKERGTDFRMADTARVQTGVSQIEEASEDDKVEKRTLEKLKEVQEMAYKEAYNLGLKEGSEKAFQDYSRKIDVQLSEFEVLIKAITNCKADLVSFNETHLVKLVFHLAAKLARRELTEDPSLILEVLKVAAEMALQEERVSVQVAPGQFEYLEEVKKQNKRELEFIKKIRFEPNEAISAGGCIIETNYGEIDATVEERVNRLWETLIENSPRVKDKMAG